MVKLAVSAALALFLAGCARPAAWEPASTAIRSPAPDAKGYVIAGLADENAHNELLSSYQELNLFLRRVDQPEGAQVSRYGCASLGGMARGETCEGQSKIVRRVLQLSAGTWRISAVAEFLNQGFPSRPVIMSAPIPPGVQFRVVPGQVTYIGDFLFSIDPETGKILLKAHTRDDAGAAAALAAFPGLQGPILYQEPGAPREAP